MTNNWLPFYIIQNKCNHFIIPSDFCNFFERFQCMYISRANITCLQGKMILTVCTEATYELINNCYLPKINILTMPNMTTPTKPVTKQVIIRFLCFPYLALTEVFFQSLSWFRNKVKNQNSVVFLISNSLFTHNCVLKL